MAAELSLLDFVLFTGSLLVSVAIGVYFANKNKSLDDFMLGGRDQRLLPVSLSMMTSFVSGLTLVGAPAELYYHGVTFSVMNLAALLSAPVSALLLLPVFHRLGAVSVFKYLELRFSPSLRRMVSLAFMVQMTVYNAVVLYVPSLSLRSVLGVDEYISIGLVGVSCLLYSTMGGIKAVIWTDFFQAGLMYLSMVAIAVGGTVELGGLAQVLQLAREAGRLDPGPLLNVDLSSRHTLLTLASGAVICNVFMNGANQIQVQRSLSLPSLRLAQYSQLLSAVFVMAISATASYIGLVLWGVFRHCDPYEAGLVDKRDALEIYYVATHLLYIPGLRGIFIAGIFAATLSTLSSFQNSMSALVIDDFVRPWWQLSERAATRLGRLVSLLFGCSCIGLAFVVGRVQGLLQLAYTLFGAMGAPLIGVFLVGMCSRLVTATGATVGVLAGYAFGLYVQLYQLANSPPLQPTLPVGVGGCAVGAGGHWNSSSVLHPVVAPEGPLEAFLNMSYFWLPVFALLVTCSVSLAVSLLSCGPRPPVDDKYLATWLQRPHDSWARSKGAKHELHD